MTAIGHKIKVAENEKQKKIFQKHFKHFTEKFHQALISNYRRVRIP